MKTDHELLRIVELASDSALTNHQHVWGGSGVTAGTNRGHDHPSIHACSHPDCALVRRLRVTMRTDEPLTNTTAVAGV